MELEVNLEKLRQEKSLFIATPMYGGQCAGLYMKSCLDLQAMCFKYGIQSRFSFLFNESLITRARNYLADEFLRSGMTHLLFIDSDINFNFEDVITLLALDKEIIGAPYPKKAIKWANVKKAIQADPDIDGDGLEKMVGDYVFNPVPGTENIDVTEPVEVLETGTGFMMVSRDTFVKFKEEYPHLRYKPDHAGQANFDGSRYIHAFFDTVIDPDTHRYLSEDYMFCQYWRNCGGSVWLCPWMKTQHVGTYAFTGDMMEISKRIGAL